DRYPGAILLDGAPDVPGFAVLSDGARITVRNGRDEREPVFRTQIAVPPGTPLDPQWTLTTTAGTIEVTKGSLSGVVASWVFTPSGPSSTPKAVALTFDDGPWPDSTDRILAVLAKMHAKATFFDVGYLAARYPQSVQAEAAAGMAVGDHSFDHPLVPPFARQPETKALDEISRARDALAA